MPDDQFSGALCECNYGFQGKRCEVGPRPLPPNEPQSAVVAGGKVEQYDRINQFLLNVAAATVTFFFFVFFFFFCCSDVLD